MIFEGRILGPVMREYEAKRLRYEAEAAQRRERIYRELPRIAEIDAELRTTVLEIVKSAFASGKDAAPMLGAIRAHNLELQGERAERLVEAGYPYDYLEAHYDCSRCSDTGYVNGDPCPCLIEAYRRAQNEELNQMLTGGEESFDRFSLEYYSKAPIPGAGVSPYEQMEEVYNFCVEYAKHFGKSSENLFMTGGSGLGKTMLASCIAREVVAGGASVVYDTAFSVFSKFEEEKFRRDAEENQTRRYFSCDLMILDDLGTEMTTAYTVAVLYNLINTRLNSGKKTILCSNMGLTELGKRYNQQTYSRVAGDYLTLVFYGEDVRAIRRRRI